MTVNLYAGTDGNAGSPPPEARPETSHLHAHADDPLARRILVVDDDPGVRRGLAANLQMHGFECRTAATADEALSMLGSEPAGIVVSDIKMPGRDGLWLLERIRAASPDTAVILLTGYAEVALATRALRLGASDFLPKPVAVLDLLTAIQRALERRRLLLANRAHHRELEDRVAAATRELREAYRRIAESYHRTLEALCSALDAREQETAEHSLRVVRYTLHLARRLGISSDALEHLQRGALLHDIGKIGIPDHILLKEGPLDEAEWRIMRRHPAIGFQILKGIEFLSPAAEIVLSHHERWDGSGYPRGLSGTDIPLGARIFSVADALDAITSRRPYREKRSFHQAVEEIRSCAGTQFDPAVVEVLCDMDPERLGAIGGPSPDGRAHDPER